MRLFAEGGTLAVVVERVLILYLRTGGGHISAARALADEFHRRDGVEPHLYNPIGGRNRISRFLIEKGYSRTSARLRMCWPFVYEVSRFRPFIDASLYIYSLFFRRKVRRYIIDHGITRVVSVHFLNGWLISDVRRGIDSPSIKACTVVTDPYTAHPIWFRRRRFPVVVFSEALRSTAIHRYNVDPQRIVVLPIILRHEFQVRLTNDKIAERKREFGFRDSTPLVLLAGGGEGLSNGDLLLAELARSSVDFDLAVVCGHSESLYERCCLVAESVSNRRVKVFGFTGRMYDLMNCSDVVIGKAGPATVMEVLLLRKPLIITSYMYGQERGNVDFVQQNRLGFFVRRPEMVRERVEHILGVPDNLAAIQENIDRIQIRSGTERIADYILAL